MSLSTKSILLALLITISFGSCGYENNIKDADKKNQNCYKSLLWQGRDFDKEYYELYLDTDRFFLYDGRSETVHRVQVDKSEYQEYFEDAYRNNTFRPDFFNKYIHQIDFDSSSFTRYNDLYYQVSTDPGRNEISFLREAFRRQINSQAENSKSSMNDLKIKPIDTVIIEEIPN